MTTLLVFTIGAIAGGLIAMGYSHFRILGIVQEQDARIFRLQRDHEAAVSRQAHGYDEDPIGFDCQFQYRSKLCGYSGPLPTCDYTLWGPNGCARHNNIERYGGKPGKRALSVRPAALRGTPAVPVIEPDSITCERG